MKYTHATVPGGTIKYNVKFLTVEDVRQLMRGAEGIETGLQGTIIIDYEDGSHTILTECNREQDPDAYGGA